MRFQQRLLTLGNLGINLPRGRSRSAPRSTPFIGRFLYFRRAITSELSEPVSSNYLFRKMYAVLGDQARHYRQSNRVE